MSLYIYYDPDQTSKSLISAEHKYPHFMNSITVINV